uniref:Uncharacterized protein n=1 Tax=Anguilla anguilla TaxID=7936 RepID=A0A0E9RR65_ANGAN
MSINELHDNSMPVVIHWFRDRKSSVIQSLRHRCRAVMHSAAAN